MSTRQRATLETTAEPAAGARLLLARTGDDAVGPAEDIGAQRLRELAARLAGTGIANSDGKDSLDDAGTEFQPVSLAAIVALGRQQKPDAPGDALTATGEAAAVSAPTPPVALLSAPAVRAPAADEAAATLDAPSMATLAPSEPLHFSNEASPALVLVDDDTPDPETADEAPSPTAESEPSFPAVLSTDQPLMLADQSAPDIRLVDLIRRQQSLLEQLNRFPPAYDTPESAAPPAPSPAADDAPSFSVVERLAPPIVTTSAPALEIVRDVPPPIPPPEIVARPTLSPPAARERKEEPPEQVLPEQSPIIIQRARAERTGRRIGPAVAAPPSSLPAFFVGLAVAVVIAGVLFVVL